MDTHQLYAYCTINSLQVVETGVCNGKSGYWFRNAVTGKDIFRSTAEMKAELAEASARLAAVN
ncbi:MAG: hypothetical protein AB7K09_00270 [Planctomycetota bacterium]